MACCSWYDFIVRLTQLGDREIAGLWSVHESLSRPMRINNFSPGSAISPVCDVALISNACRWRFARDKQKSCYFVLPNDIDQSWSYTRRRRTSKWEISNNICRCLRTKFRFSAYLNSQKSREPTHRTQSSTHSFGHAHTNMLPARRAHVHTNRIKWIVSSLQKELFFNVTNFIWIFLTIQRRVNVSSDD